MNYETVPRDLKVSNKGNQKSSKSRKSKSMILIFQFGGVAHFTTVPSLPPPTSPIVSTV